MIGNDFNKFLGFLVLGLICIIGISTLDAANITDNRHGEKTMIYIILSLTSSFFFYNARENFKRYRLNNPSNKKIYVQTDDSMCDVILKAKLNNLENDPNVIEYKNMLKRLQPECYEK